MVQIRKPTIRSEDIIDRRFESTLWSIKAGRAKMAAEAKAKAERLRLEALANALKLKSK